MAVGDQDVSKLQTGPLSDYTYVTELNEICFRNYAVFIWFVVKCSWDWLYVEVWLQILKVIRSLEIVVVKNNLINYYCGYEPLISESLSETFVFQGFLV